MTPPPTTEEMPAGPRCPLLDRAAAISRIARGDSNLSPSLAAERRRLLRQARQEPCPACQDRSHRVRDIAPHLEMSNSRVSQLTSPKRGEPQPEPQPAEPQPQEGISS